MAIQKPTTGSVTQVSQPQYLRAADAARYLKIGRSTLYQWCAERRAEGFPQPIKAGPRVSLFDMTAINQFLGAQA